MREQVRVTPQSLDRNGVYLTMLLCLPRPRKRGTLQERRSTGFGYQASLHCPGLNANLLEKRLNRLFATEKSFNRISDISRVADRINLVPQTASYGRVKKPI